MTDPYKQADRARWLRDLLCGALIGAGAILPGVSGGVLAVVFDVYRPMMETLAHPGRGIRKYWHIFLPSHHRRHVPANGVRHALSRSH